MSDIGNKIKSIRKINNISRKELAESVGIPPGSLANYENGFRNPSNDMLLKIAEALHTPLIEFLPSFGSGDLYKGLINEVINRDNPNIENINSYMKILDKKQLTYNFAYADINANEQAKENIVKYIISEARVIDSLKFLSLDINEPEDTLTSSEIDIIFDAFCFTSLIKYKDVLLERKRAALKSKKELFNFDYNSDTLITGRGSLDGTCEEIDKTKEQVSSVLNSLICYLEEIDLEDKTIDTIEEIVNKINTEKSPK